MVKIETKIFLKTSGREKKERRIYDREERRKEI